MSQLIRPGALLRLFPALLSVVAVFYLGSVRATELPELSFSFADKVGHFAAFGFVQVTHFRAGAFLLPRASVVRIAYSAALVSALWGGLLEVLQHFLPYRSADVLDFLADASGALLGAVICVRVVRWLGRGEGGDSRLSGSP